MICFFKFMIIYSCYFDGVKGNLANLFFTTVPLCIILVMNSTLYILTWWRIRQEEPRFKDQAGRDAKIIRASHRAARTMSLFVAAFIIQWWAMASYGIIQMTVDEVPLEFFQFVTTFSNIGGILNGIVYIIIRRKSKEKHSEASAENSTNNNKNSMVFKKMQNTESPSPSPVTLPKNDATNTRL